LDAFDSIDERLFSALVCTPLNIKLPENYVVGSGPIKEIVLVPKPHIIEIPLLLREPGTGANARWHTVNTVPVQELSFVFIELFQWNRYDFLNLPLVRCTIDNCPHQPEYVGREALVENHVLDFLLR
jgi:hypothetical protein